MKPETAAGAEPRKRRSRVYSAKEKAQAVLALWSGRRNTAALTKELEVPWALINMWEKQALTGMLTALDPTWKRAEEAPLSLSPRLEKLMGQPLQPAPAAEAAAAN